MNTLSVETLRTWLEEGRPVSIVDVRPTSDYQEWAIPGSIHSDAYEALKAQNPKALASLHLPADRPVVTVCATGKTSQIAAEHLALRGLQVASLEGGMQAWSLAWNTTQVPHAAATVRVIQVRRTGKGCLSYLIGAGAEAMVIDASVDPQVYLDLAQQHGWQITQVFDTHIHADHLSRSRHLAERSKARLMLPEQQRVMFPYTAVHDGEVIASKTMHLVALRTPGHTLESTCYLLNEQMLFTGDTLFPVSVGRPDLAGNQEEAQERAELLYHSLHRILALPSKTLVLPGHTSKPVPFDGVPILATIAEIDKRIGMLRASHTDFVRDVLARLPATPPNYQQIVMLNEQGRFPDSPVKELETGANRCALS